MESVEKDHEVLQSDFPANVDEFGAHERIAESIFQLIGSSEGGKTVAIEGAWGAGKSTVVRLLAAKCSAHATGVFLYDAWVHAGDPLRRAFLASLIDYLQSKEWLPRTKKWKDELELISGKQRQTTKSTTPQFTVFGRILALCFFGLVPGFASLSKGLEAIVEAKSIRIDAWSAVLFWSGAFLCLLPVLASFFHYVWCRVKDVPAQDYFAAFLNKQTSVEAMVVTDSGDPTSIEFQSLFSEALTAALDGHPNRRLVLVIDNLDRLSPEDVQKAWSLLQSFVDISAAAHVPAHRRLWVVVPVAPNFTTQLRANSSAPPEAQSLSPTFLDKIFQARFRLPPPILKNWQPYFDRLLCESVPGTSVEDRQRILALYVALRQSDHMPTPREIVLFINQLAIFSVQWKKEYALPIGAAYILEASENTLSRLEKNEIPSPIARRMASGGLKEAYACIYFNTGDVASALELLQEPIAQKLLRRPDPSEIQARITEHPSFAPILLRAYTAAVDTWIHGERERVIEASLAIVNAIERNLPSQGSLPYEAWVRDMYETVQRTVASTILDTTESLVPDAQFAELVSRGLDVGHSISSDLRDIVLLNLLSKLGRPAVGVSEIQPGVDDARFGAYNVGAHKLLQISEFCTRLASSELGWQVPGSYQQFRSFLRGLDQLGIPHARFRPAGGSTGVAHFLSSQVAQDSVSDEDTILVDWLSEVAVADISKIVASSANRLSREDGLTPPVAVSLGLFLQKVLMVVQNGASESPELARMLVLQSGVFLDDEEFEAAAVLLLPVFVTLASMSGNDASLFDGSSISAFLLNPSSQPELTEKLSHYVVRQSLQNFVVRAVLVDQAVGRLVSAMFSNRAEIGGALSELPVKDCVSTLEKLRHAFNDGNYNLVDQFLKLRWADGEVINELIASASDEIGRRWVSRCFTLSLTIPPSLYDAAVEALTAKSVEAWMSSVSVWTWDALLVVQLVGHGVKFNLPRAQQLFDALMTASETAGALKWKVKDAKVFLQTIRPSQVAELSKQAFDRVLTGQVSESPEYWNLVGSLYEQYVRRPAAQSLLIDFVKQILLKPNLIALNWLLEQLKTNVDFVRPLRTDDAKKAFYLLINAGVKSRPKGDPLVEPLLRTKRGMARFIGGSTKRIAKHRKTTSA